MTLPDPPLDAEGVLRLLDIEIREQINRGMAGLCSMCRGLTWDWWDIDAHGLDPVKDATGESTDQVPLHPACVPALIEHWAMLMEPHPDGDDADSAAGVRDHPDPTAENAPPPAPAGRRAPTGAYARRRAG